MMKKIVIFFVAGLLAVNILSAQGLAEGIKDLNYQKIKSALTVLKKLYDASPKDPQVIYWYGQALIAGEGDPSDAQIAEARTVYQKALTDGVNDAWIWVGIADLDLLQHADMNAVKQKFEQAITATKTKRGENPDILNAIGRANANEGSKYGDPVYGIEKLKRAAELNKTNPDIYNNMGLCYRKLGSESGGDAVKSFLEALTRDPKNVVAMFQIGKIYASQNNKEALENSFNGAIAADPTFPPAYLALFQYYADKDVNKAKDYLDNFLKYADKDPENDYFLADYLFRAGKYQESLAKGKEIEASVGVVAVPRLNILYAYDYDRLGDSVQAKAYLEKFFATAPPSMIEPDHYALAVKVFSKFPGSEAVAADYMQKAIDNDTSRANKFVYANEAADIFGKAKLYAGQVAWLQKADSIKGSMSEADYWKLSNAALNSADYVKTMTIAKNYITAFPDKPQGYSFNVRAAKAIDSVTAIDALAQQNEYFLRSADSVKNKKYVFQNLYFMLNTYVYKTKELDKAIEVTDKMIELYPAPGEENEYAVKTKEQLRKAVAAQNRSGSRSSGGSAGKSLSPGSRK
jgi:tetratricopeptide (TPR) repeat protein